MKVQMKNRKSYVSQAEAARIRGVSPQAISDLIRRGRLTTMAVGGRTVVLQSEVEAFVAKPKTGRPSNEMRGKRVRKAASSKESSDEIERKYISRAEAARIREVSQPAIVDLIRRGRLKTVRVAGINLLLRSEVEKFVSQPKTGRPSKKSHERTLPKSRK